MYLFFLHALLFVVLLNGANVLAQNSSAPRPLTDENGNSIGLFERVVNLKDAQVVSFTGSSVQVVEQPAPFNSYYVFDEKMLNNKQYFQVGPNAALPPIGWIAADNVFQWSNNLVVVYNEPIDRHRVLFFENSLDLSWLLADSAQINSRSLSLINGQVSSDNGLVAMEPEKFVHWSNQHYLTPVLDFIQRGKPNQRDSSLLVKTAALPLETDSMLNNQVCNEEQRIGIVFVIDTTLSMQKYIDRTREMVEQLSANLLMQKDFAGRVQFGLVGYRDELGNNQNLEYRVKTYQALSLSNDPKIFGTVLDKMKSADYSTRGFEEDGLIGVFEATRMDWDPFRSKWIVLITDAPLRDAVKGTDNRTLSVQSVANILWDEKQIGLLAIHLQTPEAKKLHQISRAEEQLKILSKWPSSSITEPSYFAVENGAVDLFGRQVESKIIEVMNNLNRTLPQLIAEAKKGGAIPQHDLAQRLHWLGKCENNSMPRMIQGWSTDKALGTSNPQLNRKSFEPHLLLNRRQMRDLAAVLSDLLDTAKVEAISGETFFANLAKALGTASIDPSQINTTNVQGRLGGANLSQAQLGDFLPGYLAQLPYLSNFLTIQQQDWSGMTGREISDWLNKVEVAINNLERHSNRVESDYMKLHPNATSDEWTYPVLLTDLP